jgi:hypothetical protein
VYTAVKRRRVMRFKRRKEDKHIVVDVAAEEEKEACRRREVLAALKNTVASTRIEGENSGIVVDSNPKNEKDGDHPLKRWFKGCSLPWSSKVKTNT